MGPVFLLNGKHILQDETAKYLGIHLGPQSEMENTHLYQKKTAGVNNPTHVLDPR
jgi:hypothetical protein